METAMSEETLRQIAKGRREPPAELAQQGAATREAMTLHETTLRRFGLTDARRQALIENVEALFKMIAQGFAQREEGRGATRQRDRELAAAKAHIRVLQQAVPMAIADARRANDSSVSMDTDEAFLIRGLGRKASGVVQYLLRVEGLVELLDPYLKPFFEGRSALEQHRALRGALSDAEAVQDTTLGQLQVATQDYYAVKGRLLEAIEDVNRIGRIAFDGNATVAAVFNKDVLLRGRRRRAPVPTPGVEPSPG